MIRDTNCVNAEIRLCEIFFCKNRGGPAYQTR
jgi:hypothetical protein